MKILAVLFGLFVVSRAGIKPKYACTIKHVPNGYWEPRYQFKFYSGQTIKIKCDDGYEVYGDDTSRCFHYGWSPAPAKCIKKVVIYKCGERDAPDNGYVFPDEDYYSPGDVIKFGCDKGYYLDGKEKDVCGKYGKWEIGVTPKCKPIRCGDREPPKYGYVDPDYDYYKIGAVITFGCDKGYYLDGVEKDVCGKDGKWKIGVTPKCKPFCYPRAPPAYGSVSPIKKIYPVGSSIQFSCEPGYYLVGQSKDRCVGSNKWFYNKTPKCIPVCPPRKPPSNGGVSPIKPFYLPKDVITFSCKPGYYLDGTEKDICLPNGKWKVNDTPKCIRITCPYRPPPKNGKVSPVQKEYYPQQYITFTCNKGYKLVGEPVDTCMKNGKWDINKTPKCVKVCYITKVRPYIYYKPEEDYYMPGDYVNFYCQKPYFLAGVEKFRCLDDGTWFPKTGFPGCVRRCYPPDIKNGGVVDERQYYNAGEWIKYYCDVGYTASVRSGQCMRDGKWSQVAVCKPIIKKCKGHKIPYGKVDPDKPWYGAGSTVEYSCQGGYTLDGKDENKCLPTGNWRYEFPICKKNPRKDTCYKRCYKNPDYHYSCQCDKWCEYRRNCCPDFAKTCTIDYEPYFITP